MEMVQLEGRWLAWDELSAFSLLPCGSCEQLSSGAQLEAARQPHSSAGQVQACGLQRAMRTRLIGHCGAGLTVAAQ